jgi:hypothetical protein
MHECVSFDWHLRVPFYCQKIVAYFRLAAISLLKILKNRKINRLAYYLLIIQ